MIVFFYFLLAPVFFFLYLVNPVIIDDTLNILEMIQ